MRAGKAHWAGAFCCAQWTHVVVRSGAALQTDAAPLFLPQTKQVRRAVLAQKNMYMRMSHAHSDKFNLTNSLNLDIFVKLHNFVRL